MDPRPDNRAVADAGAPSAAFAADAATLRKTAVWVLVVQCLLALSWTMYVLFLPGMLAAANIDKRWFIYVLISDQIIFAACDWWAGVYADRIAAVWKRLGRLMIAATMLSSAALLAMPWIAQTGSAILLLGVIYVWAATSSALRAPVFSLLGRVREDAREVGRASDSIRGGRARRAGMVSMALVGISLAGAVGPYLTLLLKSVDSRLPIAVSAIALALAGLWATRAEALLPRQTDVAIAGDSPSPVRERDQRRRSWSLAATVLVAAFGTQLLTAIVAQPLYKPFVGADAVIWVAWFWVGFGLGLIPGARIAASHRALIGASIAMAVAWIAFAIGANSASFAVLVISTTIAGAGWGVFSTVVFSSAVSLSGGRASVRGAGTASGMVFSAIAIATFLRMICTATGFAKTPTIVWLPEIAWALASVLLIVVARTVWRDQTQPSPQLAA